MDKRIIFFISAFIVMLILVIVSLNIFVQEKKTPALPVIKSQVIKEPVPEKVTPQPRDRGEFFKEEKIRVPVDGEFPLN